MRIVPKGLRQFTASDGEVEGRQVWAGEKADQVGGREEEVAVAELHALSILPAASRSYAVCDSSMADGANDDCAVVERVEDAVGADARRPQPAQAAEQRLAERLGVDREPVERFHDGVSKLVRKGEKVVARPPRQANLTHRGAGASPRRARRHARRGRPRRSPRELASSSGRRARRASPRPPPTRPSTSARRPGAPCA